MIWLKKQGINFKVVLGITATMVIVLGAIFVGTSQYIRARLWESEIQKTENINAIAKTLLEDAMMTGHKDTINEALSKLGQNVGNQQLYSIAVYDDRYLLTSFATGFPGSLTVRQESMPNSINDPSCWGCHQLPPEQRPTHLIVNVEGREVIRNSVPLYNEKRCQTCHGTGKHVLGDIMVDYSQNQFQQAYTNITLGLAGGITFAIGLVIVVLYQVISRMVLNPVQEIVQMADEMSHGTLERQIVVRSSDEIGFLARSINSMASQLRGLIGSLEQGVAERTIELNKAVTHIERRAKQFEAITKVAQSINTSANPQELLPYISQVISEQFGFYHVGIFLNDVNNQYAVLAAANSTGGQKMLERSHQLRIGKQGIVGYAINTGVPRIALDVGEDVAYFDNPDLPETHSEMALPLRIAGDIIGALDIQSTESNAFSSEDVEVLSVLANQVGFAIHNVRLFDQTQTALAESQLLYGTVVKQTWKSAMQASPQIGYRYAGIKPVPLAKEMSTPEIREALDNDNIAVTHPSRRKNENSLAVPLKLRESTIGVININFPMDTEIGEDEIDVITAASQRIALALENASLLEESQRRAKREQTISEMSAKIGAGTEVETIMKTAIRELSSHISSAQITIELESEAAAAEEEG